jgi:hypothetical protein
MRACPRPRSAFPRWWVGLGGAAGRLPSKAVTISLPREAGIGIGFRGRSRGAQPG